ncbi:hypothetical protein [Phytoactinopolyspora halotolerans]|uniref:Uncharacterized protein n=1 Tax=Phytoactinopolyspora halotolerans TaxID=1981512 RepID=A0A6L9S9R9_9ACTN|nr:hypothetical protein [Phytoactinopolyspora halotolerans]NEE01441.1 hypothetical protein [Phytoactinopolyspora halotolerans]
MTDASLAPAVLESSGETPPVPWPVIEACGLPEIGARLAGLSVRIDPAQSRPFVCDGTTLTLRPDRAATVTGSALILRETIELTRTAASSAVDGPETLRTPDWAHRILAHATALAYGATSLSARGEPAAFNAFSPLAGNATELLDLHDRLDDVASAQAIAARIAEFVAERDGLDPCPDSEIDRAARALPFAAPTEVLLASGGDTRQTIDWHGGVNSYGISPSPTPWTSLLGSCTASSPTTRGFDAASRLRRRLIEAALGYELGRCVDEHTTVMRRTLLAALGVRGDAEVVFTPSGTDAELVALLAALSADEPVHSVVVGQYEIGSGSTYAAAGRHFCGRLPSGNPCVAGEPIGGFDPAKVTTSIVDLRDPNGEMLPPEQVEAAVEAAIEAQVDTGRVLVHVVEGSKTGIRLPRRETVLRWRERFGDRLDVVVDAAQMRIDQNTAVQHLRDGNMVIVTGSKFFGGPPFSGAVILPSTVAGRLAAGRDLPAGMADYLTRADVPEALSDLRAVARRGPNAGLLLRWEAALAEMRSFHNASPEIRDEVLRLLVAGLRKILEDTPQISLVESPYTAIPQPDTRGLDDLPTIFTFLARRPDGTPLTMGQGRKVYRMLAQDLRGLVPSDDAVLGRTFQLGQPVRIHQQDGEWIGGLRVAIGATTVSEIVFDHTRGRLWIERVDRTLADVADALRKLGLILQHVDLDGGSR